MSGQGSHLSVMVAEVIEALGVQRGGCYVDGTFGAGGYSRAMLDAGADRVFGIDRDPSAIRGGRQLMTEAGGRLVLIEGRFGAMESLLDEAGAGPIDGVALDLGISSMQLDQPERGFSFQSDGPLDMRMGGEGPSAADLVNQADEATLSEWFWRYGEERHARRVARAIVAARKESAFSRTRQLVETITRAMPRVDPHHHPATRVFQALRIVVNDELAELESGLEASERVLQSGGRCAVVSFHSLEDRIVKTFFRDRSDSSPRGSRHLPERVRERSAAWRLVTRRPRSPSVAEITANPRARSARLRAAERLAEPEVERSGEAS
jgi:16S rRNA (cytosine1402-N4)-methyltransferase